MHGISPAEHLSLLEEYEWREDEFDAGFQNGVAPRDGSKHFLKYEDMVRQKLAKGQVTDAVCSNDPRSYRLRQTSRIILAPLCAHECFMFVLLLPQRPCHQRGSFPCWNVSFLGVAGSRRTALSVADDSTYPPLTIATGCLWLARRNVLAKNSSCGVVARTRHLDERFADRFSLAHTWNFSTRPPLLLGFPFHGHLPSAAAADAAASADAI